MEQESLKPCPFCGEVVETGFCGQRVMHDCVVLGGLIACFVAAWNARTAVTDEQFAMAVHDGRAWQVVRECHIRYHGGMVSEGGMEPDDRYYCDACGDELPKWAQDAWDEYATYDFDGAMPFRHCPSCGAKVIPC